MHFFFLDPAHRSSRPVHRSMVFTGRTQWINNFATGEARTRTLNFASNADTFPFSSSSTRIVLGGFAGSSSCPAFDESAGSESFSAFSACGSFTISVMVSAATSPPSSISISISPTSISSTVATSTPLICSAAPFSLERFPRPRLFSISCICFSVYSELFASDIFPVAMSGTISRFISFANASGPARKASNAFAVVSSARASSFKSLIFSLSFPTSRPFSLTSFRSPRI
mmetsp:Transcript_15002/g.61101  ORF Transcript_15002/g.61101 Transcript_15002/m.61101 type:complete len:229 (-) Transcript_15002:265-951(-)